ncbi:hypothetical protein C3L33_04569, partial [Rhododendron williamsianum]
MQREKVRKNGGSSRGVELRRGDSGESEVEPDQGTDNHAGELVQARDKDAFCGANTAITARLQAYGHIEGKNVFYWFQNHKARQRQKQKQESWPSSVGVSTSLVLCSLLSLLPPTVVVCSPYYPAESELGFYSHYPKMLQPGLIKKRPKPADTLPEKIQTSQVLINDIDDGNCSTHEELNETLGTLQLHGENTNLIPSLHHHHAPPFPLPPWPPPPSPPTHHQAPLHQSQPQLPRPSPYPLLRLFSDFSAIVSRAEGLLYTLADAAVAVDPAASTDPAAAQKNGGWFSFIADGMEVVLKVLKDGLTAVHVPYAYGFAIILITVIVKLVTFPLTKQQVESSLAMQNLQPKIKAIQERYKGNQERIQLETSRLYRQAGVNPLAGCFPTLATIPVWIGLYQALSNVANEDGHPPLGWHDTAAYLVLPVLLVASQFVSMEIMKPPQSDDPAQKNTLLVFKFLPLMIGYFSLSVPSGLSIYWFTNNVLSTAQQVWLKQLGGAKPVVNKNASGIISAGRAKRSGSQPAPTGDRFRQLKEEEKKKQLNEALPAEQVEVLASTSESEDGSDEVTNATEEEALDEVYASNGSKPLPDYSKPKRSKRSKRKRAV